VVAFDAARRGPVMLGLMLATVMSILDTTIVNVALPHMQASLSASPEQITWVITSYIVATAATTPVTGWLAARFGEKPLLLIAVAAFTVTSMLCGVAENLPQMVVFRILQGMAGAPIAPLSQAIVFNITPPQRYGRTAAVFMMGTVVAPVVGPILGAWLTDAMAWRWCFYINLPAGLGAMVLLGIFLPAAPGVRRRFDFLGFASLAVALAALQLALDQGPSRDWFASREIQLEAVIAAMGFWIFATHSLTAEHPLFDRSLARDRNLVAGALFNFVFNMVLMTGVTLLPLMMQGVMGYPIILSGLVSVPRGAVMLTTLVLVGRLDAVVDRRALIATGLAFCICGFWGMSRFDLSMPSGMIVWATMLQGVGQAFVFVPLAALSFSTISPALRPDATAISSLLRNLGGSFGVAIMQALTAFNSQSMHAALAAHVASGDPMLHAALPRALWPETAAGALALNAEITRQATMVAYVDDFRLMVVLALVCAPLIFLLRPARRQPAR
jgi:DHA2 family multidrug resistance protein